VGAVGTTRRWRFAAATKWGALTDEKDHATRIAVKHKANRAGTRLWRDVTTLLAMSPLEFV